MKETKWSTNLEKHVTALTDIRFWLTVYSINVFLVCLCLHILSTNFCISISFTLYIVTFLVLVKLTNTRQLVHTTSNKNVCETICYPPCLGEDTSSSSTSKATLSRRQFSQTQSEPETIDLPASASGPLAQQPSFDRSVTFTEPKIKVIPPSGRGSLLMHMHSEYASITDELETVCGLLSPPKSPGLLSPPRPEQSPPSKWRRRRCTVLSLSGDGGCRIVRFNNDWHLIIARLSN